MSARPRLMRKARSWREGVVSKSSTPMSGGVKRRNTGERSRAEVLLEEQNRVLELIAGDAPLSEVLTFLLRLIEAQAPGLYCSVLLLEGGHLRHGAAPSLPDAYNRAVDGVAPGPAVGSCGTAAYTGRAVIVTDIANDPLWAAYRHLALPHGLRACWSTPILSTGGEVLGTFAMYYPTPSPPRPADVHFVEVATHVARIAIERDRARRAREERAQQLAESARLKDEFLAMLGHELRNPLAPIVTALGLMRRKRNDPAALERYQAVVERQIGHLTRLIDDLLDVMRITSGKIKLARERTTAADVIARAVEVSTPLIDERHHTLGVELASEPLALDVDPIRIAQVLSNLLNNAAKYTDPGGHIGVRAAREGAEVVIRVRDDGIGIQRELLTRVFDLFAQLDRSLDRSQGGLGIGLTLVRRLVEMHGGRVEAHSEGPGRGSEFVVRLPAAEAHCIEASPPAVSAPAKRRPLRVLLVDDNADAASVLADAMKDAGDDVEVVHSGVLALAAARAWRPDVVLLDIGLPGVDGYEVARRLRAERPRGELRLIALTGYGQAADRRRVEAAGFDAHLIKPADLDRISAAVHA